VARLGDIIVGPYGINIVTVQPRIDPGYDFRYGEALIEAKRLWPRNPVMAEKAARETTDLETKLWRGQISVADVVGKNPVMGRDPAGNPIIVTDPYFSIKPETGMSWTTLLAIGGLIGGVIYLTRNK
jgi:hypothetical protein